VPEFDFAGALRRARTHAKRKVTRRRDEELPFVGAVEAGPAILLDTCVYVDQLQARAPAVVEELVNLRLTNHSTVTMVEMMHTVGRLDPAHPSTSTAIARIGLLLDAIPGHRLFAPDADVLGRAALLSGALCRLQGYAKDDRMRALHDSILFLQALKSGLTVLTRDVRDYDILLQLVPSGRALFYRRV
jgi:predicted nucleic acid-binding protein